MNIFVLDEDPMQAARMLCNKHVVKMCVESLQIMSTVMHINGMQGPYRPTHQHHPCIKWTNKSNNNGKWLSLHLQAMLNEYTNRYHREHAVEEKFKEIKHLDLFCGNYELHTTFEQCVPEIFKSNDAVKAYRRYYLIDKSRFAKWAPHALEPVWWKQ